uniref:restriction endonuclease subunit S n=1 Tax=Lactobacillus taiwanensis TaxID=508451 RepID=UPI0025A581CE
IKVNKGNTYFVKSWFVKHKNHITSTYLQGGQGNLSAKIIKKLLIKLPTLEDQGKVSNLIAQVDKLITLQQRKLELLKEIKKGLLQKMFADKSKFPILRFEGFHAEWEQRKLYEVADYRNGKAHEQHIYIHGNYIVVNSKFVSTSGEAKKYSDKLIEPLMKNEIAFVLSDVPNGKALARTFLVKRSQKYTLNQRVAGITPHPNMNSYFLFILMNRNPYFLKFDDGVGQTNLSKKDVEQFNENYPTKREQQKIGEIFVKLDSLLTLQQRKYNSFRTIIPLMLANENSFVI